MRYRQIALIALSGLLCAAFFRQGFRQTPTAVQFTPAATAPTVPATAAPTPLELPRVIPGSDLILEKLVSYEGDFWEDGSDRYAVDITAIVVYNPREQYIDEALLQLQQDGRLLSFRITCLPPNSRVLVLEQQQSRYLSATITQCRLIRLSRSSGDAPEGIRVESAGDRALRLHNDTAADQTVILSYKRYDAASGLYLGGISYDTAPIPLPAGETLLFFPERYVEGHTKVVSITVTP